MESKEAATPETIIPIAPPQLPDVLYCIASMALYLLPSGYL